MRYRRRKLSPRLSIVPSPCGRERLVIGFAPCGCDGDGWRLVGGGFFGNLPSLLGWLVGFQEPFMSFLDFREPFLSVSDCSIHIVGAHGALSKPSKWGGLERYSGGQFRVFLCNESREFFGHRLEFL